MSVIPVLAGGGTIFLEKRAHKTIYEGCQLAAARGATVKKFGFEDVDDLERLLRESSPAPRLICIDGVNSMTGNAADVEGFARLAREYDALLYVDDAHGFGVIGERTPDETQPVRQAGQQHRAATSARATTTSCSSRASRSPTRRSPRSSPARRS